MGGGGGWVVCGLMVGIMESYRVEGAVMGPMLGTDGVWGWSAWWRVGWYGLPKGSERYLSRLCAQAGAHSRVVIFWMSPRLQE